MAAVNPSEIRNSLLRTLPAEVLSTLLPYLRRVPLTYREVLHRPNEPLMSVHFPEEGYVSMLATLDDGDVAGVGMIGREGMTGVPLLLGTDRTPLEALVQSGGTGLRMEARDFRHAVGTIAPFRELLLRYAMAFHVQVTMTAACSSRHVIEQRMARWLLMADDRTDGDDFPTTHEFLSMMLGVRRAGITVAAGGCRRPG